MWPFKPKVALDFAEVTYLLRILEEEVIKSAPASIFNEDVFIQQQRIYNLLYKLQQQHQIKVTEKVYM